MVFLIVDRLQIQINEYASLLLLEDKFVNTSINKATSFLTAYEFLQKGVSQNQSFDLVIIDLDLSKEEKHPLNSGIKLVLLIKKLMPNAKIIITSIQTEFIKVYDLWKMLQPNGYAIKNDLNTNDFLLMVNKVLSGSIYKSPQVNKYINKIWEKQLLVEDYNRKILYYLDSGFRTVEIQNIMCISQSAIQKRIVKMNKAFGVVDRNGLLKEIKRLGYL